MTAKTSWKKLTAALMLSLTIAAPNFASAASDDDIDAQIEQQRQILEQLNEQKKSRDTSKLTEQISDLKQQLADLKNDQSKANRYDAQSAVDALATQIADLEMQLEDQSSAQNRIEGALENLEKLIKQKNSEDASPSYSGMSSSRALLNPGPNQNVGYTQDAINAQGNSTMVFRYAPNQVYKIYCRTGYITDIALHEGEKVKFVGGGDTSAWALNSTTVDKTPHIYIKPVVEANTTNIIITTDKRSYHLIVNTSDWYNPMVTWTYDQEKQAMNLVQEQKDEKEITGTFSGSYDSLNFDYSIKAKNSDYKPVMVFDDGEKTIIKFSKMSKKLPALFIREKGKKTVSLANFKVKDNCYIIDRVIDQAELRYSDNESVTITRK